ncbi:hypothetical protein Dimus_020362 [Dionaea muscipula]
MQCTDPLHTKLNPSALMSTAETTMPKKAHERKTQQHPSSVQITAETQHHTPKGNAKHLKTQLTQIQLNHQIPTGRPHLKQQPTSQTPAYKSTSKHHQSVW